MSNEQHDLYFTQGEAAKLIGVNKSTFTRWNLPHKKKQNRKLYYAPDLLKEPVVIKILLERNAETENKSELEVARIAQTKALTKKLEIETKQKKLDYDIKKEKLIPDKDIETLLCYLIVNSRSKFLPLKRKIATLVIGMTNEIEIENLVGELIDEALEELANVED